MVRLQDEFGQFRNGIPGILLCPRRWQGIPFRWWNIESLSAATSYLHMRLVSFLQHCPLGEELLLEVSELEQFEKMKMLTGYSHDGPFQFSLVGNKQDNFSGTLQNSLRTWSFYLQKFLNQGRPV